jgi:serine/threonine protein kinase
MQTCAFCTYRSQSSTCPDHGRTMIPHSVLDSEFAPYQTDEQVANAYKFGRLMHSTKTSWSYEARALDGTGAFAITVFPQGFLRARDDCGAFLAMAQAWSALRQEHVASVLHALFSSEGHPLVVCRKASPPPLETVLGELDAPAPTWSLGDRLLCLEEICLALRELHLNQLRHGDLRPGTVAYNSDTKSTELLFPGPWRFAERNGDIRRPEEPIVHGVSAYQAPECLRNEDSDEAADWFSLGVLVYEILGHALPWPTTGESRERLLLRLTTDPEPLALEGVPNALQEPLKSLATKLLAADPTKRPGPGEILGVLGDLRLSWEKANRSAAGARSRSDARPSSSPAPEEKPPQPAPRPISRPVAAQPTPSSGTPRPVAERPRPAVVPSMPKEAAAPVAATPPVQVEAFSEDVVDIDWDDIEDIGEPARPIATRFDTRPTRDAPVAEKLPSAPRATSRPAPSTEVDKDDQLKLAPSSRVLEKPTGGSAEQPPRPHPRAVATADLDTPPAPERRPTRTIRAPHPRRSRGPTVAVLAVAALLVVVLGAIAFLLMTRGERTMPEPDWVQANTPEPLAAAVTQPPRATTTPPARVPAPVPAPAPVPPPAPVTPQHSGGSSSTGAEEASEPEDAAGKPGIASGQTAPAPSATAETPAPSPPPGGDEAVAPDGDEGHKGVADAPEETKAAPGPKEVFVAIVSDPAGATVHRGREVLGRTPLTIPRPQRGSVRLSLRMRGYTGENISVAASGPEEIRVALQRRAPRPQSPKSDSDSKDRQEQDGSLEIPWL